MLQTTNYKSISDPDQCITHLPRCKKLKNDINLCWFEIDKKSWLFNYKGCLDKPDRWWSDKKEKWIGSKKKDFFPFLFKKWIGPNGSFHNFAVDEHRPVDESFTQVQKKYHFPCSATKPNWHSRKSLWVSLKTTQTFISSQINSLYFCLQIYINI